MIDHSLFQEPLEDERAFTNLCLCHLEVNLKSQLWSTEVSTVYRCPYGGADVSIQDLGAAKDDAPCRHEASSFGKQCRVDSTPPTAMLTALRKGSLSHQIHNAVKVSWAEGASRKPEQATA